MDEVATKLNESVTKFKKLKKGMYVRWVADRMFRAWNTVCFVTIKKVDRAILLSFDDFAEVEILSTGDSIREEITIITKEEAMLYLKKRIGQLNVDRQKSIEKHKLEIESIDALSVKLNNCLQEHGG